MKPTEFSVNLGENLKHLRNLRGLTAAQLSDILGITPDEVRKYERGERMLSIERMITFATALECSEQNILEGLDPRHGINARSKHEIKMMDASEHRIMLYMATEWGGDRKALIIADAEYMLLPPHRRRNIMMHLDEEIRAAVAAGEINEDDLPEEIDYMRQALGGLFDR